MSKLIHWRQTTFITQSYLVVEPRWIPRISWYAGLSVQDVDFRIYEGSTNLHWVKLNTSLIHLHYKWRWQKKLCRVGLTFGNNILLLVMCGVSAGILQTERASINKRTITCHSFILNGGSASTKDIVSNKCPCI